MKKSTTTKIGKHFNNIYLGDIVKYKSKLCIYKGRTSISDLCIDIDIFILKEINNDKFYALTENDIITINFWQ